MKKKTIKKKAGRPPGPGPRGHRTKIEIDFELLEGLCKIQCTAEEIAGVMGVSVDTIGRRIEEKESITFADYYKKHSDAGKASLRRLQFKHAKKNPGMAIFLGKNLLRQSDKQEITGADGGPQIIEITDYRSKEMDERFGGKDKK